MEDARRSELTIRVKPEYQIIPPLSGSERDALRENIALRGVQVQIEVEEEGHVLDGHHRREDDRDEIHV